MNNLVPRPEQSISKQPTADLWEACQQAGYPITFEWPDGSRTIYTTPAESYADLWARSMVKEAQTIGGIATLKDETQ